MKLFTTIILCLFTVLISHSQNLEAFQIDNKWGFKNAKGKESIAPKYDLAGYFHEGFAPVRLNGKWGFVNTKGKEIIPLIYDDSGEGGFENGFASVYIRHQGWGFINTKGQMITPLKYDAVNDFLDGYALVKLDFKWGLIDTKGNEVIIPKYDMIGGKGFREGLIPVKLDGKWGYANQEGKEVIVTTYHRVSDFQNGKAKVTLDDKTFYIDKNGNETE